MISKIKKNGFTLMETLIAVLVLSLAITGPLTIAQKGLQAALISKDQVTAFYLAQDAIEYIRYARDTNCLVAGSPSGGCPTGQWLAGTGAVGPTNLTNCVSATGATACTIDVIAFTQPAACTIVIVNGHSICSTAINYDSTKNYFTYGSGLASIFTRTVSIQNDPAGASPNEAVLSVMVSWSDPISHSVTVKENIFNWQ